MAIFTIGHSTRRFEDFLAALRTAAVDIVADVRQFPFSRRHPQFNGSVLSHELAAEGIGYRHLPALGGRRARRRGGLPSPNTLWREASFRNYADYAQSAEFRAGFDELLAVARVGRPAIMCAEAVWWRCHRRIITDYLLVAGMPVEHILDVGKIEPARLTPGAKPQPDGTILYAASDLLL